MSGMMASGFRCLQCGCDLADFLKMYPHEGDIVVELRCKYCRYEWKELVQCLRADSASTQESNTTS